MILVKFFYLFRMKQFKVINQLYLIDGELMCKKPSKRSFQKAHFKQGDLDGACGAYSVAMVLNILGAFEAEDICSDNQIDKRTSEWKLIKALNEEGLYRDGLTSDRIQEILLENYRSRVTVQCASKASKHDIAEITKNWIDNDSPVILRLGFDKNNGHWVVAVGYIEDEHGVLTDILTLDPGSKSPSYALWNGILNLHKEPRKKFGYRYVKEEKYMVDFDEAIIIRKK